MPKKVLFTASIFPHFKAFHIPYFKWFKEKGWEVHAAAKSSEIKELPYCDKLIDVPIERSPYSIKNIKAYKELKRTIDKENYDVIHCHTPMASILTRLAARKTRKKGTKVLYTAHGFHFFKGAPKINWLLYFSLEKFVSRFTDAIITINREDFDAIGKYKFKCKNAFQVHGVGVNTERLLQPSQELKKKLRTEYGFSNNDFILIYIAEFIPRKNQQFVIESVPRLIMNIKNLKILFVGNGIQLDEMKGLSSKMNLNDHIQFLGFRTDIGNLIALSDIGISASRQEGLGLNVAEYMFGGLPVVVTEDRGHFEMVKHNSNGFMFPQNDKELFIESILKLYNNNDKRNEMSKKAYESIQKFSIENAVEEHDKIYQQFI